jgi:hypothetical protein
LAGLAAVAILSFGTTAQADVIPFDPDNGGSDAPIQVASFDFLPGNSLAVNSVPFAAIPGSTFELRFQAKLGAFLNAANLPIMGTGLNSAYEITAVARFTERVTFSNGVTSAFDLAPAQINPPPIVELWFDNTPDANDLAGTGFNDGTLILRGIVTDNIGSFSVTPGQITLFDQFGADNYGGRQSVTGAGAVSLTASLLAGGAFVDNTFFLTAFPNFLDFAFVNSSNITPFRQVDPSALFLGLLANPGAVNGVTGPDFQFQTDANASFRQFIIPAPPSIILMGLGMCSLGLTRFIRRKPRVVA